MGKGRIDQALYGKPKLRAQLEAVAADPGVSIAKVKRAARRMGIDSSRTAVGRWMQGTRRRAGGSSQTLLAAVIRKVIDLDETELAALAKRLGVPMKL